MPLEIDPKHLRLRYAFVNIYAGLYALMPLIILSRLIMFVITNENGYLIDVGFLTFVFVMFARRIFLNHIRLNYMIDAYYHGKDKDKLKDWAIPTSWHKIYDKLPLPTIPTDNMLRRLRK